MTGPHPPPGTLALPGHSLVLPAKATSAFGCLKPQGEARASSQLIVQKSLGSCPLTLMNSTFSINISPLEAAWLQYGKFMILLHPSPLLSNLLSFLLFLSLALNEPSRSKNQFRKLFFMLICWLGELAVFHPMSSNLGLRYRVAFVPQQAQRSEIA